MLPPLVNVKSMLLWELVHSLNLPSSELFQECREQIHAYEPVQFLMRFKYSSPETEYSSECSL